MHSKRIAKNIEIYIYKEDEHATMEMFILILILNTQINIASGYSLPFVIQSIKIALI